MNTRLAWADRLIAVISPDYVPTRYSPMEWASQIWNDPDGTKGSVIPVIVRPTPNIPPLLKGLSRIDLTNCSEDEARRRLIKGVERPAPPERKPAFEKIKGEAPDSQHAGPAEKPTFIQVNVDDGVPRWLKLSVGHRCGRGCGLCGPDLLLRWWRERKGMQDHPWRNGGVRRLQGPTRSTAKLNAILVPWFIDRHRTLVLAGEYRRGSCAWISPIGTNRPCRLLLVWVRNLGSSCQMVPAGR